MVTVNADNHYVNENNEYVDAAGNPVSSPVEHVQEKVMALTESELKELLRKNLEDNKSAILEEVKKAVGSKSNDGYSLKDLASTIREAVSSANEGSQRTLARLPIREEEIPTDDFLDTPVEFYVYSQTYTIFDDTRKGHTVMPPYGKIIKFHNLFRTKNTSANSKFDGGTIAIAFARIHSKKQVEWLRNHSNYNTKFFESIEQAKNVSALFADMLRQAEMRVPRTEFEIIQKAKEFNLSMSTDLTQLRSSVVYAIASQMMDAEKKRVYVPTASVPNEVTAATTPSAF